MLAACQQILIANIDLCFKPCTLFVSDIGKFDIDFVSQQQINSKIQIPLDTWHPYKGISTRSYQW